MKFAALLSVKNATERSAIWIAGIPLLRSAHAPSASPAAPLAGTSEPIASSDRPSSVADRHVMRSQKTGLNITT